MVSDVKLNKYNRKHWIRLSIQIYKLFLNKKNKQPYLTNLSYNKISNTYDYAWTNHMRNSSKDMINRLSLPLKGKGLDLTCGTGYVTGLLAEKINGEVTGVDSSQGMINVATQKFGNKCNFVCSDIFDYLNKQPSESVDVVTCAWGMGYTKPFKLIKEISRILKPNGQVGIIDSNLFTLFEVVKSGILTVAEYPLAITNVMNIRWLLSSGSLNIRMMLCGLQVLSSWKGEKTHYAKDGNEAIDRLISTGSSAGIDFCFDEAYHKIIRNRFAEIFEEQYRSVKRLPITVRYIGAVAKKS